MKIVVIIVIRNWKVGRKGIAGSDLL